MDSSPIDAGVLDGDIVTAIRALGLPGEPDVFAEVASLFLTDVPVHLAALTAAIAASHTAAVWRIAHRLHGSALEMGAVRMAPLCAAIELGARAGSLADAAPRAAALDHEFGLLRDALEQATR